MRRKGLQNVQTLEMPGAHPYAYGEWTQARRGAPPCSSTRTTTCSPPGDEGEVEQPDPFEPVERDGRLFARGAADDKAGILVHIAAIDCLAQGARRAAGQREDRSSRARRRPGSGSLPAFLRSTATCCRRTPSCSPTRQLRHRAAVITTALRGLVTVRSR